MKTISKVFFVLLLSVLFIGFSYAAQAKEKPIKVGVVLAGCGVMDGSEIHEAMLTLFFLDKAGAEIICMAPDNDQYHVVNHLTGKEAKGEKRNILVEAARIARGNIKDIKGIKATDLDALIIPGGYGAAKNLCNFAVKGADCTVNPEVERLIKEMHRAGKPIGFICIAPVIAAKVLGAKVTIGNDKDTADAIEKMGGKHVVRTVDDIAVDEKNKVVSTPAYMLGPTISKVALGIEKLVNKVLEMA
ncbi:MAG: isoprenoid biosynthesis glyoxalase ElbB [Desulfurellaceae bacterium]|nr:isoprenoid biosynthesis glyoxalase ElbB [Desulfurellaceae bacterium]